jgi:hypothetical protein
MKPNSTHLNQRENQEAEAHNPNNQHNPRELTTSGHRSTNPQKSIHNPTQPTSTTQ